MVWLVDREVADRYVEFHIVVERHELLRQPRLVGVLDQRLPTLFLLDLAGALQQRFQIAVLADELCGSLHPDTRHPGHVVSGNRQSAIALR